MSLSRPLATGVALVLAAGCADERSARHGPFPTRRTRARWSATRTRSPAALSPQVTNAASQRLVIRAEFALAQVPEFREQVEKLTLNRAGRGMYYALAETCEGRDASFKPARLAVEGVRQGRYRAAKNRPG